MAIFGCSRGVRQGDPLSPLILCLVEEFFNRLIIRFMDNGRLIPMHAPGKVVCPSHFFFVDDVLQRPT